MELNICHLYPDILNLYGDRGNIITMKRRLEGRGIKVNIDECSIGQPLNADKYDIFFIGGGQDFEQEVLLRRISDQVVALTAKYGGLMWGEHGKGFRSEYSPAFFGELWEELQRVKGAFDQIGRAHV